MLSMQPAMVRNKRSRNSRKSTKFARSTNYPIEVPSSTHAAAPPQEPILPLLPDPASTPTPDLAAEPAPAPSMVRNTRSRNSRKSAKFARSTNYPIEAPSSTHAAAPPQEPILPLLPAPAPSPAPASTPTPDLAAEPALSPSMVRNKRKRNSRKSAKFARSTNYPIEVPSSTHAAVPPPQEPILPVLPAPVSTPTPDLAAEPAPTPSTTSAPAINLASSHSSTSSERKNDKFWTVDVIDDQSVTKEVQLNMQGIWLLPVGQRIILHFNESGQPIGEAGGLIGGFLGTIATDVKLFPISYRVWKKVPNSSKDKCYYDVIKEKFHFEDAIGKHWILGSIAKHWRNNRSSLFKKFYKFERSREENIEKHPPWIPKDMWIAFVDYRLDPATMKMSEKNTANRKKLVIPHTGGSKSFARKKHEMETKIGKPVSRGALYVATRKRKDGSYVTEEARINSEKIIEIETQQTSSQMIGQQDSLAQVLGPEHTGRVRGLGFGPTPSQVFKHSGVQFPPNAGGGVSKDKLAQLESQLQSETERRKTLENLIQYMFKGVFGNAPVPPEFAQIVNLEADRNEPCPSSSASHEPQA